MTKEFQKFLKTHIFEKHGFDINSYLEKMMDEIEDEYLKEKKQLRASPFALNDQLIAKTKKWMASRSDDAPDLEYNIRQIIISARHKSAFSQREIAEKIGTTQAVISQYESGKSNPTIYFIQRLADALGIEIKLISVKRL